MPDITPRIFISYSRKDGETFAADLRTKLADEFSKELLWRDREGMEGGRDWWQQIVEALDHVEYMVLVATPEAMKSPIVKKEWRMARQKGVCVCPIQVPGLPIDFNSLPRWMRDVHFYNLDMEWNTFIAFLTAPCRATKVPFMAPDLPDNFVDRRGLFKELKAQLLDADRQNPVVVTTALQGTGGFGKTTLAAALCHDEDMQTAFDDGVLWVTLGEKPDLVNALAKLYRALADDEPNFRDEEEGANRVSEKLAELDCLVVIDDIWDSAHLRPFMRGGKRCSRLLTTRDIGIATVAKASMTEVGEMTTEESIELLGAGLDGVDRSQLANLAQRLGEYAQMLEIANGMMHEKMAVSGDSVSGALAWLTRVLDRQGILGISRDDQAERKRGIAGLLSGSLELLKLEQRQRLYELGIFKDDEEIPLSSVMQLWGLDDFATEHDILKLARLTLLKYSTSTSSVRLHDVIREYLLTHIADQPALHARLIAAWGDPCTLRDGYAWRHYAYHMKAAGKLTELRALLFDFNWLQAKLDATGISELLADYDYFPHDDTIHLLQSAIDFAYHNSLYYEFKDQLGALIGGRLAIYRENPDIAALLESGKCPKGIFRLVNSEQSKDILAAAPLLLASIKSKRRVYGVQQLSGKRVLTWAVNGEQDNSLKLKTLDGKLLEVLEEHTDGINGALELTDKRILTWSDDKTLRLWDTDGHILVTLQGHDNPVYGAIELPDGRLLSWSESMLHRWSSDGSSYEVIKATDWVKDIVKLPDGRLLALYQEGWLQLFSANVEAQQLMHGHHDWARDALQLENGRLLSWGYDEWLQLWEPDGKRLAVLQHANTVRGAIEYSEGRILSWAADDTLRLWDAEGHPLIVLCDTGIDCCTVLKDGQTIVAGNGNGQVMFLRPDL